MPANVTSSPGGTRTCREAHSSPAPCVPTLQPDRLGNDPSGKPARDWCPLSRLALCWQGRHGVRLREGSSRPSETRTFHATSRRMLWESPLHSPASFWGCEERGSPPGEELASLTRVCSALNTRV